MAARDPQTGRFVSDDNQEFDRFEEVHSGKYLSVPASDVGGQTGQEFGQQGVFEGLVLYNADLFLDRDEIAVMLWASHRLVAMPLSTASADGTIKALVEISASPEREVTQLVNAQDIADTGGNFTVQQDQATRQVDSGDIVGRNLTAIGTSPITDGTNGVGGAGSAGDDTWQGQPVSNPVWDVRDDVFLNGSIEHSNVDDNALYAHVEVHHQFGVMEDF